MPRVAIVGSFSTGKTTLAEAVTEPLGLPLLPEVAREVAAMGFKLDKEATPEVETLIFLRQYANEMTHPDFVGDRSLIDVMAYAGWVLDNQDRRREFALWEECLRVAEHRLRSQYTHVFYLPIEFDIVPDGLRPMDPDFQRDIDARMLALLDRHDVAYETLRGSVEERTEALVASVGDRPRSPAT
ncbi:MAG TPA: ATP-binding protein [Actinomycetota bacterium]